MSVRCEHKRYLEDPLKEFLKGFAQTACAVVRCTLLLNQDILNRNHCEITENIAVSLHV